MEKNYFSYIIIIASTISFSVPNRVNIDRINKYYEDISGMVMKDFHTIQFEWFNNNHYIFIEEMEDAAKFLNVSRKSIWHYLTT